MSDVNLEQIIALLTMVQAKKITRESMEKFLLFPGDKTYKVTVDYSQNIRDMLYAGNYHLDDPWCGAGGIITEDNFPLDHSLGVVDYSLELYQLEKGPKNRRNVLKQLKQAGVRPATIEMLLAFGATYPDVQKTLSVSCLIPIKLIDRLYYTLIILDYDGGWHYKDTRLIHFSGQSYAPSKDPKGEYDPNFSSDNRILVVR